METFQDYVDDQHGGFVIQGVLGTVFEIAKRSSIAVLGHGLEGLAVYKCFTKTTERFQDSKQNNSKAFKHTLFSESFTQEPIHLKMPSYFITGANRGLGVSSKPHQRHQPHANSHSSNLSVNYRLTQVTRLLGLFATRLPLRRR